MLLLNDWVRLKRKVSKEAEKVSDKTVLAGKTEQCAVWVGRDGGRDRDLPCLDCRQHMRGAKGFSETEFRIFNMAPGTQEHFNEKLVIATIV